MIAFDIKFDFYTLTVDYYATGEGRIIIGMICQSYSEDGARSLFAKEFDEYWAGMAEVNKGIIKKNPVVKFLFTPAALKAIADTWNCRILKSSYRFNLS